MMMRLTLLLLLALCIAGIHGQDALDALFDSLTEDSAVLSPEADGKAPLKTEEEKALDRLNEKGRDDALDVLNNLYTKHQIKPLQVLDITKTRQIVIREDLPFVGPWIAETVKLEFADRNPDVAAKLLNSANDLLQISYVGCNGFPCAKSVSQIHSKYQNMMYEAESVSYDSVRKSMKILMYIRAAVGHPDKADELLGKVVEYAKEFVGIYQKLEDDTDKLIEDSMKADGDVEDQKVDVANKWKQARAEIAQVEATIKGQKKQQALLKKRVEEQKKKLASVGINRAKFTAKFLILAGTEVKDTEECDSQVLQQYKEITNYVTNYIKYSKGGFGINLGVDTPKGGGSLGIDVQLPDGLKSWKDKKITSERANDIVDRRCWKKKDVVAMNDLNNKLNAMIKENDGIRQEYLQLLKDLKDFEDKRSDIVLAITEGIGKLGYFNDVTKKDYNVAVKGLAYTTASLRLVKTIFLEAKYFWKSQVSFIQNKLAKGKSDEDLIAEILQEKPGLRIYRERALRTGMDYLVFSSVSFKMYNTMKEGKDRITDTLATVLTKAKQKEVLDNANNVINTIKDLRSTIQKQKDTQKKDMADKIKTETSKLEVVAVTSDAYLLSLGVDLNKKSPDTGLTDLLNGN